MYFFGNILALGLTVLVYTQFRPSEEAKDKTIDFALKTKSESLNL
jgi:hypothetical protein